MKVRKAPLLTTAFVLVILLAAQVIQSHSRPNYILNLSSSEPLGIYRLDTFRGKIRRDEIVWMKAPEQAGAIIYDRGWLPQGWPLLKHIKAIPGDTYCVTDAGLTINDRYVGPVSEVDTKGYPLPKIRGCFTVELGQFLPIATHIENSFDGRYFGAVPQSSIIATASPVLTF